MIKFAFLWLIIIAVLVTLIVYGVRAIIARRHEWAIADAKWEVDVVPGKDQTDIVLQEVARIGSKCKVLRSQIYRTVSRNEIGHDLEVEVCKQEAERYVSGTLT